MIADRKTRRLRALILASVLWMMCGFLSLPCTAQNVKQLLTATGGIAISGPMNGPFTASYGNVNGLGIGTPTGSVETPVSLGEFYYTPYTMVVSGAGGGNPALVKAWVSSPFTNSSTVLQLFSCPFGGSCTPLNSTTGYTNMPVTRATATTVLPNQTANMNYDAYLGLLVGDVNGVTLTSPDTVQVTFDIYNGSNNSLKHSIVLNLSVTPQTAVEMQLATGSGGQTINFNSNTVDPSYTTSFGTVNGLGIGPGAGLAVVNGQTFTNGIVYATPYLIEPQYSGFGTTSSTSVTALLSSPFPTGSPLQLYDSVTANSGYSQITTSPLSLTGSSYTNGTPVTRYLGLYVSNLNGASLTGSETATITYTILVH